MVNPYESPHAVEDALGERPALPLRLSSVASFGCGFVAFMAYYGYRAHMTPLWIFWVIPVLTFLACWFAVMGLAVPWQPTVKTSVSKSLIGLGFLFPLVCLGVAAALDATATKGGVWLLFMYLLPMAASLAMGLTTILVHRTTIARRLAIIGYGIGILLWTTYLVDILYPPWVR